MKKGISIAIGALLVIIAFVVSSKQETEVPTETSKPEPAAKAAGFSQAELAAHNSRSDCYTSIAGKAYDLTDWIAKHPGGADAILSLCGKDGTAAFSVQHGSSANAQAALAAFYRGELLTQ